MWRRALASTATAAAQLRGQFRRALSTKKKPPSLAPAGMSSAVDSIILRSLKDHYLEASKMTPPPKVSPPAPFSVVKGALDRKGGTPVLRRTYKDEEITVSVMRLANYVPEADEDDESINQLFLHVDVAKAGRDHAVHFLCALYPDALGIHSVRLGPKLISSDNLAKCQSRSFQELDQRIRDAFHAYIEERGIDENLFPFLQAWLYVKDHRNLMKWFKSVGTFVSQEKSSSPAN